MPCHSYPTRYRGDPYYSPNAGERDRPAPQGSRAAAQEFSRSLHKAEQVGSYLPVGLCV